MGDTFAVQALRRERAHLAGEIEVAERTIARQGASLANLGAAIPLFDETGDSTLIRSIRPIERGKWFRHAEQTRLCLAASRESVTGLTVREVTEFAMQAKGLNTDDDPVRRVITEQTRAILVKLAGRGLVWRFEGKPVMWSTPPICSGGPSGQFGKADPPCSEISCNHH